MNTSSSNPGRKVLLLAVERGLLDREDCNRLIREAERRLTNPTDIAIEQSLLAPLRLNYCKPWLIPTSLFPAMRSRI